MSALLEQLQAARSELVRGLELLRDAASDEGETPEQHTLLKESMDHALDALTALDRKIASEQEQGR